MDKHDLGSKKPWFIVTETRNRPPWRTLRSRLKDRLHQAEECGALFMGASFIVMTLFGVDGAKKGVDLYQALNPRESHTTTVPHTGLTGPSHLHHQDSTLDLWRHIWDLSGCIKFLSQDLRRPCSDFGNASQAIHASRFNSRKQVLSQERLWLYVRILHFRCLLEL